MRRVFCQDCGKTFFRADEEDWKTRCVPCFKKSKRAESLTPDSYWVDRASVAEFQVSALQQQVANLSSEVRDLTCRLLRQPEPRTSGLDSELKTHLRALIQYCHPDKHSGSQGATQVTQWLNDVKRRLPCG